MIEAAHSPGADLADAYLRDLEHSRSGKKLDQLADIAVVFEEFAHTGELAIPRELNDLVDGLREIKVGKHRFPFFHPRSDTKYPLRLTHGFEKQTEKTPRKHIDKAKWVRRKDLES
ncbi:type II toxin-antitoxin system RelE/ParE family toxin [Phaeacidiphilus oryzae]|uniref:type II toxin-antitoxin system RelE/ParE family toxin n=1 Tax=Phaeacidiphilus oryzae TaxID=348818 RepID=UPI0005675DD1|nr:type II toxin-antitoxin system RelE/ParE family toxin [Phaeacidiphilus oryzae]